MADTDFFSSSGTAPNLWLFKIRYVFFFSLCLLAWLHFPALAVRAILVLWMRAGSLLFRWNWKPPQIAIFATLATMSLQADLWQSTALQIATVGGLMAGARRGWLSRMCLGFAATLPLILTFQSVNVLSLLCILIFWIFAVALLYPFCLLGFFFRPLQPVSDFLIAFTEQFSRFLSEAISHFPSIPRVQLPLFWGWIYVVMIASFFWIRMRLANRGFHH